MNRPITVVAGCIDPTRSYVSTEIGYAVSHGVDFLLKHKSAASSWPTTIIKHGCYYFVSDTYKISQVSCVVPITVLLFRKS